MSAAFGPLRVRYREPAWALASGAAVVTLLGFVVAMTGALTAPTDRHDWSASGMSIGFLVVFLGLMAFIYAAAAPPRKEREAMLAVEQGRLTIDGRPVREAVTATRLAGHELSIFCGYPRARLVVSFDEAALALALADALTPTSAELPSYRVSGTGTTIGKVAFGAGVMAISLGNALAIVLGEPAWFLLMGIGIGLVFSRSTARVGSDGVVISRLGVDTFFSFSNEAAIAKLRTLNHDELMKRVDSERASAAASAPVEQLLARGDRTTDAWKAHLREVARASYRGAAIETDRLWDIVKRSTSDDSTRLGAALILRARGENIRIAAESTASPELRVALTEIADADDPLAEADRDIIAG